MRIAVRVLMIIGWITAGAVCLYAQENPLNQRLKITSTVPKGLLAGRSFVFYQAQFTDEQLKEIQSYFQKTGIDAVGYFSEDLVFASREVSKIIVDYLNKREVDFIVLLDRTGKEFAITFVPFNRTYEFVNRDEGAWRSTGADLTEVLETIYRTAINDQPRKNHLINDFPERDFNLDFIPGRRSDFFAIDLKVDKLAVPWFEEAGKDSLLVELFKTHYPYKYDMVNPGQLGKADLRKAGFHYVMEYVYTTGEVAQEILEYTVVPSGKSALVSVTYPEGVLKLKTISAQAPVYKFYFKHIESGNIFLGTKWDADLSWDEALVNHLKGFKAELKIP